MGLFDAPFLKSQVEVVNVNASELNSRDVLKVEKYSTLSPEQSTVSAEPLHANNAGVGLMSKSYNLQSENIVFIEFFLKIILRDDSDLHLSRFVVKDRNGQCGGSFTDLKVGDKGFIRSPNYPSSYPANKKCSWWLKARDECD